MRSIRIDERRLRVAMAAAGINTYKDLSEKSGVDLRTINNIKRLGTCQFEAWNRLAATIGCNPIDLLVTQGYPNPNWAALAALSI